MTKWPGWAIAIVVVNVLVASGFAIAGLVTTSDAYAMYAAARTVPLAIAVIACAGSRRWAAFGVLAYLAAAIQACDAVVGLAQHDVGKTVGPAVLAVATIVAARMAPRST